MDIILTKYNIEEFLNGGSINGKQIALLGIKHRKGWKRRLIGKTISLQDHNKLISLKGVTSTKKITSLSTKEKESDHNHKKSEPDKSWTKSELHNPLWDSVRQQVLDRDGRHCTQCGSSSFLQIHHTFYYNQKVPPWEYPLDSLMSLCGKCHRKWHKDNKVEYKNNYTYKDEKSLSELQLIKSFVSFLLKNDCLNDNFNAALLKKYYDQYEEKKST